jgi:hypothetical protein
MADLLKGVPPVTDARDPGPDLAVAERMSAEFTQETAGSSSRAAERMRLYRKRRRQGLQLVRIPLRATEIDDLVRMGRLTEDQRHNVEALQAAVLGLFHIAMEEERDSWSYRASCPQ